MELVASIATAWDFADALDDGGNLPIRMSRQAFGDFARQVDAGAAVTLRTRAGALVMIAGLYPSPGWAEGWWAVGPAARTHIGLAVRAIRRIFAGIGRDSAPLEVRAHIPADSVAGHRFARMLGLSRGEEITLAPWGRLTVWRRSF